MARRLLCWLVTVVLVVNSVLVLPQPTHHEHVPYPEAKQPAKFVRYSMAEIRGTSSAIYMHGARGD